MLFTPYASYPAAIRRPRLVYGEPSSLDYSWCGERCSSWLGFAPFVFSHGIRWLFYCGVSLLFGSHSSATHTHTHRHERMQHSVALGILSLKWHFMLSASSVLKWSCSFSAVAGPLTGYVTEAKLSFVNMFESVYMRI